MSVSPAVIVVDLDISEPLTGGTCNFPCFFFGEECVANIKKQVEVGMVDLNNEVERSPRGRECPAGVMLQAELDAPGDRIFGQRP